jgi:hypothetical protein
MSPCENGPPPRWPVESKVPCGAKSAAMALSRFANPRARSPEAAIPRPSCTSPSRALAFLGGWPPAVFLCARHPLRLCVATTPAFNAKTPRREAWSSDAGPQRRCVGILTGHVDRGDGFMAAKKRRSRQEGETSWKGRKGIGAKEWAWPTRCLRRRKQVSCARLENAGGSCW